MVEGSVVIHTLNHNVTTPPPPFPPHKSKTSLFPRLTGWNEGGVNWIRCPCPVRAPDAEESNCVGGRGSEITTLGPWLPSWRYGPRGQMVLWQRYYYLPRCVNQLVPSQISAKRRASWDTLTEAAAAVPTPPQAVFAVARKTLRNARESSPSPISPNDCKNSNRLLMDGCLHKAWAKEGLTLRKIHGVLTIRSNLWITSVWL